MAISKEDFRDHYTPDSGEIQFLHSGSDIIAIIISTSTCDNENIAETLQNMTFVQFIVDGNTYTSDIISRLNKTTHYYFEIEPIQVSSTAGNPSCSTSIYASDDSSRVFTNSDFNAIIGNATNPESSTYIFNVDRKKNQTSPTNINGILSGSAERAEVQISNYSDSGLKRGRYEGTKTNLLDFGTIPTVTGTAFIGANFSLGTSTNFICNIINNSDRTQTVELEELISSTNNRLRSTPDTFNPDIRKEVISNETFVIPDNEELVLIQLPGDVDVEEGDILELQGTGVIEIGKVITLIGKPTPGSNLTTFTVKRGYRKDVITNPINNGITISKFTRIAGDIIYKFEDNTNNFFKLTNTLILIEENEKIYFIDSDGSLLAEIQDCNP